MVTNESTSRVKQALLNNWALRERKDGEKRWSFRSVKKADFSENDVAKTLEKYASFALVDIAKARNVNQTANPEQYKQTRNKAFAWICKAYEVYSAECGVTIYPRRSIVDKWIVKLASMKHEQTSTQEYLKRARALLNLAEIDIGRALREEEREINTVANEKTLEIVAGAQPQQEPQQEPQQ